ncbi:hypothetical protein Taro_016311, partial [Colocasia esculenta]|nr:hypothetical protein [Colocasia esculenta]
TCTLRGYLFLVVHCVLVFSGGVVELCYVEVVWALVSTLPDLVSTHCPKTSQKVFWEGL